MNRNTKELYMVKLVRNIRAYRATNKIASAYLSTRQPTNVAIFHIPETNIVNLSGNKYISKRKLFHSIVVHPQDAIEFPNIFDKLCVIINQARHIISHTSESVVYISIK